jgi:hypothetical protein
MALVEVNVCGTPLLEQLVLIRILDIRRIIATCCNVETADVRLAFHPFQTILGNRNHNDDCEIMFEVRQVERAGIIHPHALNLLKRLCCDISRLNQFTVGMSIPQGDGSGCLAIMHAAK